MATYIVKTHTDRTLLISAKKYEFHFNESAYVFFGEDGEQVANVQKHNVLAIVEDTASKGDFYQHYDLDDEDCGAHEMLERAVDILVAEDAGADEDGFWEDYFAFVGVPEVDAPEEVSVG